MIYEFRIKSLLIPNAYKFPKVISKWGTGCLKNPLADCSHCGTLKKSFAPQKKGRAEIFLEANYDPI